MIHRQREPHGRAAAVELEKYLEQATLQRLEHDREVRSAVVHLHAVNAERRLQDQRDLDADYRNYIVPV